MEDRQGGEKDKETEHNTQRERERGVRGRGRNGQRNRGEGESTITILRGERQQRVVKRMLLDPKKAFRDSLALRFSRFEHHCGFGLDPIHQPLLQRDVFVNPTCTVSVKILPFTNILLSVICSKEQNLHKNTSA